MNGLYSWLLLFGLVVLLLGVFTKWFQKRWYLTEPLMGVVLGVILGPAGLGLLSLSVTGDQTRLLQEVSRVTLAVADMGVALRLPSRYPLKNWRSLAVVLGLGMVLMMAVSGLLVWGLLSVSFWVAMLIGATVASTDPIVATTIVTGDIAEKYVPARVRHFISAESGANDGAVYPLVLLPILVLTQPQGEVISQWLVDVIGWQIGGAVLVGALLGYGSSRLLTWTESVGIVEKGTFLAYTFALTFVVLGAARLLGVDGVLAAFVAGIAYRMGPGTEEPTEEAQIQQAMTKFFVLPAFVFVGLAIPWDAWLELGWRGPLLAVLILLLRRPPVIAGLSRWFRPLQTRKETVFTAWFGPIGISTLFYAMLAERQTGLGSIWPVASLLLCASLVAHGLSATPFSRRMGGGESGDTSTESERP